MIKQFRMPTVLWSDNAVFSDLSQSALDLSRDNFALASLSHTQDYIYFGLYKQFSSIYVEMYTANAAATTFAIEYYDGSSWTAIANPLDETKGFSRSGFIKWDLNQTNWASTTINSIDKYYIRMRPAADFDAGCIVRGINIVFSDDQDLKQEIPDVANFLSSAETSFILIHQACRDDIIQNIRNSGKVKYNPFLVNTLIDNSFLEVDAWDFLEIDQIRQWSKYLALSKIMENMSKAENDIYWIRHKRFDEKAKEAASLYYITLDITDDGKKDPGETVTRGYSSGRLVR